MKKLIIMTFLLVMIGHPPRADAQTIDSVTSRTSVTFVANPKLPEPSVPGGSPDTSQPTGNLPKTGESQTNLLPLGLALVLMSTMLFLKKSNKYSNFLCERKNIL